LTWALPWPEQGGEVPVDEVLLVVAVFSACVVESVGALTIVLAVGLVSGWVGTVRGGAGLVVSAVIVAVLGPAVTVLPIGALRLPTGGLLLLFGPHWLRTAIRRASGCRASRDADEIFSLHRAAAERAATSPDKALVDAYAFTLAFKGVLLGGLQVALIVVTLGANQHGILLATTAAATAVVLVAEAGVVLRVPLSRVPESALKFAVGILLISFGIYWGVEGAGASWPDSGAVLPGIIVFVLAVAVGVRADAPASRVAPR
jgi:uncharacterized membrane protein